ncbi:recombinase family protein [Paraclostridium sordellii]|uniref:recombinase family protein n=1 Tax=Paraclostridium sordellii TaxID=1505 RepID=UPI0005DF5194|nr:recombinase family protein [Paeniclostridium sordellii]CEO20600.1 Site-specific recombinase [[Clostridium] sordellii] [Paeniclostridium sordellii]
MISAIYSRKSKFTGKGESIENQIQLCMDYAKNLGINEFLVYEDEGFSGKSMDRPKFKEMLKDAKDKKFDYLICYRLDRISRNVSDFSTLIEDLNKLNISFVSIKEQFDTSTPMGRAMMYISSVFAQLERETIAERVRDNMYELARTGRWLGGMPPYGFISTQINYYDENMNQRKMYKLKVDEDTIDIVKLIFDKYLELRSLSKLYKYMYENGIKGTRGGNLDPSALSLILKNPAYVKADKSVVDYLRKSNIDVMGDIDNIHGILTYAKNTDSPIAAVAKHEGVIDSDKWIEAQRLLNANKAKAPRAGTGSKALLSGLLKCSKCGSNMRITYKNSKSSTIYYYICGTKKSLGVSACDCRNIRSDKAEFKVIDELKNKNIKSIMSSYKDSKLENAKDRKNIKTEINLINNQIKEKEIYIDNLVMQLAKVTESSASTFIINKLESLNNDLSNLKSQLESLNTVSIKNKQVDININMLIDNLNKFNKEIDTSDINKKRLLLSTVVDYMTWDSDTDTIKVNLIGINSSNTIASGK